MTADEDLVEPAMDAKAMGSVELGVVNPAFIDIPLDDVQVRARRLIAEARGARSALHDTPAVW